jgi:cysteine synthase A
VLNTTVYDEIIRIKDDEAFSIGRLLATKDGVLTGISSGAATAAAIKLARRPENEGKTIVVLLPDTGERYLSTQMFNHE